jgi:hypothetical protein
MAKIYVHVMSRQIICERCADEPMIGFMKFDNKTRFSAFNGKEVTCSVCGSLR